MIVFDLICDSEHRFEGWFASREEFDRQVMAGLIECPICGSSQAKKIATASRINTMNGERPEAEARGAPGQVETEVLAKLVRYVVAHTENVGSAFPEEARKIHYREVPRKPIRGTASSEEVADLKEEGIDVFSLPLPIPGGDKLH